jgi:hypothetical protein
MTSLDTLARDASAELRPWSAGLEPPDLERAAPVRLVELDDGRDDARDERSPHHRRFVAVAAAAAVAALVLGAVVVASDDPAVETAGPAPLTRTEWLALADEQCLAAAGRPGIATDDPAALPAAVREERAFIALVRRTASDALERGVPDDLVAPTQFAVDGLDAIDGLLADAESALAAGDTSRAEQRLNAVPALSDRVLLRLAAAGARSCAPGTAP